MKKLSLLASLALLSTSTYAQIPANAVNADPAGPGPYMVGGGSSINGSGQVNYYVENASTALPGTNGVIPAGSLEVTIGFPSQYGIANNTVPTVNNWTVVSYTTGPSGQLVITNNNAIDAGNTEDAIVNVAGFTVVGTPQSSTMTVDRSVPIQVGNINTANDITQVSLVVAAPLPVTLRSFNAKEQSCGIVVLNWESAKETNMNRYEVEFSADGRDYQMIKSLDAQNAANGAKYSTSVQQNASGYYRLKMVDHDGMFEYSTVNKVNMSDCGNIQLAPTVTSGNARIMGLTGSETIKVMNSIGQIMISQQARGENENIDMSRFAAGMYQVIVVRGTEQVFAGKIVKQ